MHIVRLCDSLPETLRGRAVAIGNFDGVHLGHRHLLDATARAEGTTGPAVLTFEPPPAQVLRPGWEPRRLTTLRGKVRKLCAAGIKTLYVQRFSMKFAAQTAEEFVQQTLKSQLGARHVVVGRDFQFGSGRKGDASTLAKAGLFNLTVVDPVTDAKGETYASTAIRALVKAGKTEDAARALGRLWEVEGRVRRGEMRGRKLGFPTANLSYGVHLPPADGIYSAWAGIIDGERTHWHIAAVSTGVRPHFGGGARTLEAHLLDFDGNLYGRLLRVAFVKRLRPEQECADEDALAAMIAEDARKVRAMLENTSAPPENS